MDWTRHKGGVHRAEDGHVVRRLDADTFALWRPGASIDDEPLATFTTLDKARQHAADGELAATAAAAPIKKGTKVADAETETETETKHARGSTRGNTIEARMERAAQAAETQGLTEYAATCRALIEGEGKKPAKTWTAKLRATLPEEVGEDKIKAVKIAWRLAGRFEADLDEEKRLKQVYADAYYLERA